MKLNLLIFSIGLLSCCGANASVMKDNLQPLKKTQTVRNLPALAAQEESYETNFGGLLQGTQDLQESPSVCHLSGSVKQEEPRCTNSGKDPLLLDGEEFSNNCLSCPALPPIEIDESNKLLGSVDSSITTKKQEVKQTEKNYSLDLALSSTNSKVKVYTFGELSIVVEVKQLVSAPKTIEQQNKETTKALLVQDLTEANADGKLRQFFAEIGNKMPHKTEGVTQPSVRSCATACLIKLEELIKKLTSKLK